jgi:hypothetical protein
MKLTCLISLFLLIIWSPAVCESAEELDLLALHNGQIIEGCIMEESDESVTMETIGGTILLPRDRVKTISKAQPGESALVLGRSLMQKSNFSKAQAMLERARRYDTWKRDAQKVLEELRQKILEEEEAQSLKEQEKIDSIVSAHGVKAGLQAMQQTQNDYWGSYRGKLHLLMVRERLDHLDLREAERQLALAEQYGVDKEKWEAARQEVMDFKNRSVLFGKRDMAKIAALPKPTPKAESSKFLSLIKIAKENGEKLPSEPLIRAVDYHAKLNKLDPLLVWAIIDTESSWRVDAVSKVGAQGLMQLMPGTAKELNVSNSFNPEENIRGGTRYMRFLLEMFEDLDTALAAYNVGPGRVERSDGIPAAGKRYIEKVRSRHALLKQRFGA